MDNNPYIYLVINQINIMNNLSASYEKILETLQAIEPKMNFRRQIRTPKLSDLELIALAITAEYMSLDSESQLFRMIPSSLAGRIERSVYNRRKRALFGKITRLQTEMARRINPASDVLIVDSMPLEICKLSREKRSQICRKDYYTAPSKGYCATQRNWYYGYKLHMVCSLDGVIQSFDLTKASVHDIHYLKDVKELHRDCILLGDRGYFSVPCKVDLFESAHIRLETPMPRKRLNYKPQAPIFKRCRKRIETLFSQLCDQFMIRRNYAKTFDGFKTRILSKITAITAIQLINMQLGRKLNNLKASIA